MNEKFECQKEKLISIKHEISLLYQQINFLLRNEKALELLDLDVLMNRTHTLYDLLCSIDLGGEIGDEDVPFDAEALSGLFGGMTPDDTEPAQEEALEEENAPSEEEISVEEETPAKEEVQEEEVIIAEEEVPVEEKQNVVVEPIQPVVAEEEAPAETDEGPMSDKYGFFFRFEDIPEKEVVPEDEKEEVPMEKTEKEEETEKDYPVVEVNGKVVHVMEAIPEEEIPERDRVHGDDLVTDNPLVMPRMEDEISLDRDEIGRESQESVTNVFGQDDGGFELSTGDTLGEKMMGDDHSLAAKLQQRSVGDLKSAIGMNEKFLFVNELFGGSMDRYNKAIENLNDLKTLNGAMIYLNELKIELQWNSSNEAYQRLKELVSHKFE